MRLEIGGWVESGSGGGGVCVRGGGSGGGKKPVTSFVVIVSYNMSSLKFCWFFLQFPNRFVAFCSSYMCTSTRRSALLARPLLCAGRRGVVGVVEAGGERGCVQNSFPMGVTSGRRS